MFKAMLLSAVLLIICVQFNHGNPHHQLHDDSDISSSSLSSVQATFLKPKANIMRRLNPLKLLFTVAVVPGRNPPYSVEWNLALLKTILLESSHVSDEDKAFFMMEFSNYANDFADWSAEKHDQLERFTEKYFNLYKSPETFLPFIDCPALTYALTDEMINDLQPNVDERKRAEVRARAVNRLCDVE